jgi:hypothetical protein
MDFPEAWDYVRETELDEHATACSYRVTQGGMLCDCFILMDEYERRKAAVHYLDKERL